MAALIGSKTCHSCEHIMRLQNNLHCRRYPPVPFMLINGAEARIISSYPPVQPEMPCGEYKRNEINAAVEMHEADTGLRQ